jgi:hypothetical protein
MSFSVSFTPAVPTKAWTIGSSEIGRQPGRLVDLGPDDLEI